MWKVVVDDLERVSDHKVLKRPSQITTWTDNMKLWPPVSYADIFNYLVLSEGEDGEKIRNYKSLESYKYFHANKVGCVLFNEPAEGFIYLQAEVIPSLAVNSAKHRAWVLLSQDGVVQTAGCSCIAGRGRSCSHAGAILWKVEYAVSTGKTGQSCTDQQQTWNKGTLRNLEPKRTTSMRFQHHKASSSYNAVNCRFAAAPLPALPHCLSHDDLQKHAEGGTLKYVFLVKDTLISKCVSAELKAVTVSASEPPESVLTHDAHSSDLMCRKCKLFYEKYVALSPESIVKVEQQTKQSESTLWYDARKLRITASSVRKVPVRSTTNADNFLREHIYPSFRGNAATRHGKENEPIALNALKDLGFDAEKRGTVVSLTEPWLSASPDGVAHDILVEVKCPYGKSLSEVTAAKASDVKFVDGLPVLQPAGIRGYYSQVQLGMYCCRLKVCKLFLWTKDAHILVDVPCDVNYLQEQIARLKRFYFCSMLPRLVDDFSEGRLQIGKEYLQLLDL